MDKKLQDKLYNKYPELFCQKKLSMKETCMCWGIETGDGWFSLLDNICSYINWNIKNNPHYYPMVEFTQVKEKFGTLRLYYSTRLMTKEEYNKSKKKNIFLPDTYKEYCDKPLEGHGEIEGAISFAEYLSRTICETCGQPGSTQEILKWWYTTCPKHADEIKKKRTI